MAKRNVFLPIVCLTVTSSVIAFSTPVVAESLKVTQQRSAVQAGAPIRLKHRVEGPMEAGASAVFHMSFSLPRDTEQLSLSFRDNPALEFDSLLDGQLQSPVENGRLQLQLPVYWLENGKHYLRIQAQTSGGSNWSKMLIVPLQIGPKSDIPASTAKPTAIKIPALK